MSKRRRHTQTRPRPSDRAGQQAPPAVVPDESPPDGLVLEVPPLDCEQVLMLTSLIAIGGLDDHLGMVSAAIGDRRRLLRQAQSLHALASIVVGDRVRLNDSVRPLYLHGQSGTVAGWAGERVVVQLDVPVGRFTTGEVRCPPLGLDVLRTARLS